MISLQFPPNIIFYVQNIHITKPQIIASDSFVGVLGGVIGEASFYSNITDCSLTEANIGAGFASSIGGIAGSILGTFGSSSSDKINEIKFSLRAQAQNLYPDINNPLNIKDDEEFLSTVVLGAEGQMVLNPAKEATINHVTNTIVELIEN